MTRYGHRLAQAVEEKLNAPHQQPSKRQCDENANIESNPKNVRVSHTGHCETRCAGGQQPHAEAASATSVQEPQASTDSGGIPSQGLNTSATAQDQGIKRNRHGDGQESNGRGQQHRIRRTGGDDYGADILSVMENEGVILELSGLVRPTSDKINITRAIKSIRPCFGIWALSP